MTVCQGLDWPVRGRSIPEVGGPRPATHWSKICRGSPAGPGPEGWLIWAFWSPQTGIIHLTTYGASVIISGSSLLLD